jgi:transposase
MTEFEWRVIEPLLPNKPRGVPRVDDRRVLNGIFWVLRSGSPWRDLPGRYGPYTTCYNRFRRWTKAGVWDRIMDAITDAQFRGHNTKSGLAHAHIAWDAPHLIGLQAHDGFQSRVASPKFVWFWARSANWPCRLSPKRPTLAPIKGQRGLPECKPVEMPGERAF